MRLLSKQINRIKRSYSHKFILFVIIYSRYTPRREYCTLRVLLASFVHLDNRDKKMSGSKKEEHIFYTQPSRAIIGHFIANVSWLLQVTRELHTWRSTGEIGRKDRPSLRVRIWIARVSSRGRRTWWRIFSAARSPGSSVYTATTRARAKPVCKGTLGPGIRTAISTSSTLTSSESLPSECFSDRSDNKNNTKCHTELICTGGAECVANSKLNVYHDVDHDVDDVDDEYSATRFGNLRTLLFGWDNT